MSRERGIYLNPAAVDALFAFIDAATESYNRGCTAVEQNRSLWQLQGYLAAELSAAVTAVRGDEDLGREASVTWIGAAE